MMRKTKYRMVVASISAVVWAAIVAPEVLAWGTHSSWTNPGTMSNCFGTDDFENEIEGHSFVSTNALQTLWAIDEDDTCGLVTEASGKNSSGTIFTPKPKTHQNPNEPTGQSASATVPQNAAKHRCRVDYQPTCFTEDCIICYL